MPKIDRPLWYIDYYKDTRDKLNLSNNVCYDQILINELNFNIDFDKIYQYPDAAETYHELSRYYQIDPKTIAIGYGAGDIIFRLFNYFKNYSISIHTPTYELANTFAVNQGMNVQSSIDLDSLSNDILYLANPNGITGEFLNKETIINLSKKFKFIILDEAYGDFCRYECSFFRESYKLPNIVVIKTFSKSIASPGIRFGYCSSNVDFINDFQNSRSSTVITAITPYLIPKLLNSITNHVNRMILTKNYIEQKYLCKPSHGNFVLFKEDPKLNCIVKKTPQGYYRMALTDLNTFIKLENDKSID